ncbi:MAG TPA: glycosyl hydrolase family 18 protein [Candidatus Obscuribacterales bacterium]
MNTVKSFLKLKRYGTIAFFLLSLLLILIAIDYRTYPSVTTIGGRSFNRGENGLWLRYLWYFGKHSEAENRAMSERLKREQIRYAYFHVRSITKDGGLQYHFKYNATKLVSMLHRDAPSVKVMAWVYAGASPGTGDVDLSDESVREKMVGEALWLVNDCGFDGIQWDYEFCPNGDQNFLKLMSETREALPAGKLLSAATPMWYPGALWGWDDNYFCQVARTCDQLAVMCYDSFFYLPRAYVWLVRQQAVHVTRAVAASNPNCRVLLGLPTYDKGTAGHNNQAETILMALKGVREGLADPRTALAAFAGVALFADYTTDPPEWRSYENLWLETDALNPSESL